MTVLILAEHDGKALCEASYKAVNAAHQISDDVHILVTGSEISDVSNEASKISCISRVIEAGGYSASNFTAENIAPVICMGAENYSHIIAPTGDFADDIMPRAAAILGTEQISGVTAIISDRVFERAIYAGNAIETVESNQNITFLTIFTPAFDAYEEKDGSAPIEEIETPKDSGLSSFIDMEVFEMDRPELANAKIVVGGGQGIGSKESFELLGKLADKLGAALGATRAAVDSGFASSDIQIGQSGKSIAPDLYIAIGVSGTIQHMAGVRNAKTIVAINNDPGAAIFDSADYGLVANLLDVIPELTDKMYSNFT